MGTAFGSAIDRRTLLKASLVAGVAVVVRPVAEYAQTTQRGRVIGAVQSAWSIGYAGVLVANTLAAWRRLNSPGA